MILPNLPGIMFAYDARQGVKLQPLEPASVGLFDYAIDTVQDISGRGVTLERRRSGSDPYRAMQVPFSPNSGINGHPAPAYAPAIDFRADQQSALNAYGFTADMGGLTLNGSFVVLAAMRAPTVANGRLMSWFSSSETSGGSDDGLAGMYVGRSELTDAIVFMRGMVDQNPTAWEGTGLEPRLPQSITAPVVLDQVYRIAAVCSDASLNLYFDNVEVGASPPYLHVPMGPTGKFSLGGQSNAFAGHNAQAWDGPIVFAIGANVAWDAAELAELDAWIVEEFNLV